MIIKKQHSGVDLSHIDASIGANDKESEVLFPRNTRFKFINWHYDKIDKKYVVFVEETNNE
jgi:lj928 prophage protein